MAETEFKAAEESQDLTLQQLQELGMWDEEWQIEGGLSIVGCMQTPAPDESKEHKLKTLFECLKESGFKVHEAEDVEGKFAFIGYPMPKPKDDPPKEQTPEQPIKEL